ncbi:MAG TPA: hypothetical protein VEY92_09230 [Pseudoxanthomonas sp.]|nr:hypothetical protein [Pseudoxanthomonas sp.]
MRPIIALPCLSLLLLAPVLRAAEPVPEITRELGKPQPTGAVHTLRTIPEACVRFEGRFTGNAAAPYDFATVRTSPQCQPRARLVPFEQAKPSVAVGWLLNDLIRVPTMACATQQAVVRVWRKPADNAPKLDGQGSARVYLQEAKEAAASGKRPPAIPAFAAELKMEGQACR